MSPSEPLSSALSVAGSPVTASMSGTTIVMTAKGAGSITNYSFTTSYTYDSTDFTYTSFSASPTSGSLTGGSGGISSAPFVTTYTYDVLGNLTQVTIENSCGRVRLFYDSPLGGNNLQFRVYLAEV